MKAPAAPHDPHRAMERRGAGFELNYTRDTGRWQDRKWEFIPATLTDGRASGIGQKCPRSNPK